MTKRIATYESILEDEGVLVTNQAHTGRGHLRFLVEYEGAKRIFIAPGSCGDFRGLTKFRGDVRRWVREVASAPQLTAL
jgi:hypothetical protein